MTGTKCGSTKSKRHEEISSRAYLNWCAAGKPPGNGREFWLVAEAELNADKNKAFMENKSSEIKNKLPLLSSVQDDAVDKETSSVKPVRYIAVRGVRELFRGNDLKTILNIVSKLEDNLFSDVVVWDLGTESSPTINVIASTCKGWLTINIKGREQIHENFGISFTPREIQVLKQFFEVWKLDSGMTISQAINNIYDQSYVKDFIPGPGQIRLSRDEFKVFVNKLLGIVNHVFNEK